MNPKVARLQKLRAKLAAVEQIWEAVRANDLEKQVMSFFQYLALRTSLADELGALEHEMSMEVTQ